MAESAERKALRLARRALLGTISGGKSSERPSEENRSDAVPVKVSAETDSSATL
jgi:hypothetical protein